ncbi:MAG: DNA translocase FtsK 4TM domain-containing protein, partial [Nannocystaceae bacterium]
NRKSSRSAPKRTPEPGIPRPWSEFLGVALLAIGALTIGGLFSFQFGDGTLMGPVGTVVASALYSVFGMTSYLLAAGVVALGAKALLGDMVDLELGESLGFTAATVAACILLHITFDAHRIHGYTVGGLLGELLGEVSIGLFDTLGTYIVALALLVTGLVASTPLTLDHLLYGSALCGKAVVTASSYAWNVTTGLISALRREQAEDGEVSEEAYDDELVEDEYEYEDEEAELEDDEEYEYEDEEAELEDDEEYEYEYEYVYEDEDEEAEQEVAAAPKKSKSKSKTKSKAKSKAKSTGEKGDKKSDKSTAKKSTKKSTTKKSTKKAADEADNGDEPRKNRKLDRPRELPEIVVAEPEPKPKPEPAAKATPSPAQTNPNIEITEREDDVDESTPVNGVDREPSEVSAANNNRKKAPLRPEDLIKARKAKAEAKPGVKSIPGVIRLGSGDFKLPPSKLFEAANAETVEVDKGFVLEQAERIEHALAHFKIRGKVTKIHPGPVITRYEFKPEAGVKLSRIESLENDLAMALEAIRIRILAPIPGKATVGFEVPNKDREMVTIKEILDGEAFGAK